MHYILPLIVGQMGVPGASGFLPNSVPGMSIMGYMSVIPLAIAAFLLKTRTLTFNRAAQMITITKRGLLGRSKRPIRWPANLQGAALACRRPSSDSGTTYRAVLHFSDGWALSGDTLFDHGPGPSRTVNAINAWFGPVVQAGGQTLNLNGPEAAEAIAALEKLGIKIPR